jgi:transmembrane sensor
MTTMNKSLQEQADLYGIAAEWHTRVDHPDAGPIVRAQLDVWLAADPRHAAAYRAIERACMDLGEVAADPRVLEFRHEALAAVSSGGVRRSARGFFGAAREWALGPSALVAAAAAFVVVAIVAALAWRGISPTIAPTLAGQKLDAGIFTTAVGERSTVTLSDGSSVALDTQSRIDVSYSPEQRAVRLVSGQAWFQVAHNTAWPFVVDAGDRRITALGTAFDVRLDDRDSTVHVTLVEGKVAVEAIRSPLARLIRSAPPASVLAPGESLVVSDAQPALSRHADLAKVGSWREGQIVFDDDTLETAIAEMNRYSTQQIVLADASLAALRVSGVFKAGHSRNFIEAVTGHYAIRAENVDGRIVLTSR